MGVNENRDYKHSDYEFRTNDPYAFRKYKIIISWLPQDDDLHILNAGCGSGEMNWLLASQNSTWTVDAIDGDTQAIQLSKEFAERYHLQNLQIYESNIEDFRTDMRYDIIVANDVLEHIEDVVYAIKCLHRLMKPDGVLYISVPALQCLFGYHDVSLGHYRRYNRVMMREQLDSMFSIERSRYFGALLVPVALWYSRIRNQPYPLKSQEDKQSLSARIVNFILKLEERIHLGTGTSLLVQARRLNKGL